MSIFRKLFGEKDESHGGQQQQVFKSSGGIKAMGVGLQRRFAKGVQYNMKIVIRGDRNVGKSALLARLKGLDFVQQYIPTEEIEVGNVHWAFRRRSEDVVKVEVWDVVDRSRRRKQIGLKTEHNMTGTEGVDENPCLDAEFLDVYKGCHGVIMVLDMTKSWTLAYVERELPQVPSGLPVLVLANHRDMGHHRTVTADQVRAVIDSLHHQHLNDDDGGAGSIRYAESSMKNGYGLVYVHRFFNIPFLRLQRDTLMGLLETNTRDSEEALNELAEMETSTDSSYDAFIRSIKSVKVAAAASKPSSLSVNLSNPPSQINSPTSPVATPDGGTISNGPSRPPIHPPQARPIPGMDRLGLYPLPVPTTTATTDANSIANKEVVKSSDKKEAFDFVPDEHGGDLSSFLDESGVARMSRGVSVSASSAGGNNGDDDDSSDENNGVNNQHHIRRNNPMVAALQDDIDVDAALPSVEDNNRSSRHYSLDTSSSDDGGDGSVSVIKVVSQQQPQRNNHVSVDMDVKVEMDVKVDSSDDDDDDNDNVDIDVVTAENTVVATKKRHHHHHHHKKSSSHAPVSSSSSKRKSKHKHKDSSSVQQQGQQLSPDPFDVTNEDMSDSLERFLNG